jgi:hypothetical protein
MKFKPLQNFPENQNKPEKPFSKVWIYFIVEIFMQKKFLTFLYLGKYRNTCFEKGKFKFISRILVMCLYNHSDSVHYKSRMLLSSKFLIYGITLNADECISLGHVQH